MLRKISFIMSVIGIAFLMSLLTYPAQEEVYSLEGLAVNEKVFLESVVESERAFGKFKIWKMENIDFDVVCDCEKSYLKKSIRLEGFVEEFNGKKQLRVLRVSILD